MSDADGLGHLLSGLILGLIVLYISCGVTYAASSVPGAVGLRAVRIRTLWGSGARR